MTCNTVSNGQSLIVADNGEKNNDHHDILKKENFKLYFYPRAYHLVLAGWFSSTLSNDLSVIYFLNLGGVRVLISRKKKIGSKGSQLEEKK